MIIFIGGITITEIEHKCLLYLGSDPEEWLQNTLAEKAATRQNALIDEWRTKLFADPAVTELPANNHELCNLIMARDDYKTRLQQDAEQDPPEVMRRNNIARFEDTSRVGPTITLFPSGIDVTDLDVDCILAYVQDLDDWVIGALLGHINKGKKLMLREWQPIIMADSSVTTMPATEYGLIEMIVSRDDYQERNN